MPRTRRCSLTIKLLVLENANDWIVQSVLARKTNLNWNEYTPIYNILTEKGFLEKRDGDVPRSFEVRTTPKGLSLLDYISDIKNFLGDFIL